jgi:hypothetical protein
MSHTMLVASYRYGAPSQGLHAGHAFTIITRHFVNVSV